MVAPVVNMTSYEKSFGARSRTNLLVLHSAECPLQGGYAQSLTNWANTPLAAGGVVASWNTFVDPIARVQMLPKSHSAWHASESNICSIGYEQSGYARFTRAEWLTDAGKVQLENLAFEMAQDAKAYGIPARWLSDAEVRRAINVGDIKGFATHRQIDPETRTDPGNGYPLDLLINRVRELLGDTSVTPAPAPVNPPVLAANDRVVGAYGVKVRSSAVIGDNVVNTLGSGFPATMKGFVYGATANGSNVWFVSIDGYYLHISGFDNRSLAGLPDLTAKAAQAPAPVAPAASTGKKLTLPASATSWNVYPLDRAPVNGNQSGKLNPSLFGGLTYDIIRMAQSNVAVIQTANFGTVQIYVGLETGAVIGGAAAAPAPAPAARVNVVRNAGPYGVKHRTSAVVADGNIKAVYDPGTPCHIAGYVTGAPANGSNVWFVGALSGGYLHISGFANQSLAGLPKLN